MISRKFIILSLIILGILYFGFNFFSNPSDNEVVMSQNTLTQDKN